MKKIYHQIFDQIQKSNSILLHLHPSPDGDSIGSTLAMYYYLKDIGKKVTLIKGDSDLPQNFKKLPNYSEISLKNYFELTISDYDLFLILDTADINQISKLDKIDFPPNLFTIVIDHHASNPKFGRLNLIDTSVMSTCQIVYELLHSWKYSINSSSAINLFVGIYTDTGGFKYPKTTFRTFQIASHLSKINPEFSKYIFEIENNADPGQILFKGIALTSVKLYFQNRVAISSVSFDCLKQNHLSRRHSEKSDISNTLKSVIGWDIGISMVEYEPNICSISMRTRDASKYDLSIIAQATGAGGGHPVAAGATIYKSLPDAIKFLLEIIQKLYPNISQS